MLLNSGVGKDSWESPLDCKEIQPVYPKGNQSWIFIGSTDAEAETPILWPPDGKNWLIGKDPDAGKDWRQEIGDTWSNKQVWPWSTKWSRAKANSFTKRMHLPEHSLPTTQEMTLHMDITRWTIPKSDWLYSLQPKMDKLYTVSKNKTWSWVWLRSWAPYCKIPS